MPQGEKKYTELKACSIDQEDSGGCFQHYSVEYFANIKT